MRALVGFGLFALVSLCVADPRDFSVDVKPVFDSGSAWNGAPVAVDIENRGPDARGTLFASEDGETTRYPIELPTGSKKRIVVYQGGSAYGMPPEYILDTDQGRLRIPYVARGTFTYGNTSIVAMISDTAGELAFLRRLDDRAGSEQSSVFADAYCAPESAPERPVGYGGIGAVILGSGCERLSDASVEALQSYVLTGGTLIFVGGASAAVLADPRWAPVLPGRDYRTSTIKGSQVLSDISGQPMTESLTIAVGKPVASARSRFEGRAPILSERGFGLGRIAVLAFNPFEEPLVRWPGKRRLFLQQVRDSDYVFGNQFLTQFGSIGSDPYSYPSRSPYYSSGYSGTASPNDPFSIKLPGASKVFWILAAFFATVVPLNFLILRKLGKGEWAWVTAPVISLAFSMVFLNQAGDLYSANLSTATTGVVVVHDSAPEAVFVGTTQIFFPNGGTYDLKMENVDQLGAGADSYEYYDRGSARSQVNAIDVGTVKVPDLRVANLAFEEIAYRQRLDNRIRLKVRTVRVDANRVRFTVKNTTPSILRNAALIIRGTRYPLNQLQPGQEQSLEANMVLSSAPASEHLAMITRHQNIAVVVADAFEGLRPGPQIGTEVAARTSIRLVYVVELPLGGNL